MGLHRKAPSQYPNFAPGTLRGPLRQEQQAKIKSHHYAGAAYAITCVHGPRRLCTVCAEVLLLCQ